LLPEDKKKQISGFVSKRQGLGGRAAASGPRLDTRAINAALRAPLFHGGAMGSAAAIAPPIIPSRIKTDTSSNNFLPYAGLDSCVGLEVVNNLGTAKQLQV
jgi:hypothetical protein